MMAARRPMAAKTPSQEHENSDHSDQDSDTDKEARYERIKDQSPTRENDEGDEIADGLVWVLRRGVVAEQEADDFLDGIGEILDQPISTEHPEVAPQGDLIQDNSDNSDSESDSEKEANHGQIRDQSPTLEIDEGDEIADGLDWVLRPGVIAEQEADDFLNGIGEILDETICTEQPEVAPQGDMIQDNNGHSDSGSDGKNEANYERMGQSPTQEIEGGDEIADGLDWAPRPVVVVAEQEAGSFPYRIGDDLDEQMDIEEPAVAPLANPIDADLMQVDRIQDQQPAEYIAAEQLQQRLQAGQNILTAQAQQAHEVRERYQAEQIAQGQVQALALAQAPAEACRLYHTEQASLNAQAQVKAQDLQEAQRAQEIEAQRLQRAITLQQVQEVDQQAQEAYSRHKAGQSISPQLPTVISPSSSLYVISTPPSSSPPAASPLLPIFTPISSTSPLTPPQASFIPPSPNPAPPKKLQKQKREESPELNEGKKKKRDEELSAACSPPSPLPLLPLKRQKQTTGGSTGLQQGEEGKRAGELAAIASPPSTSPALPQKKQNQPMEDSLRVKQGKKRERDDESELPRKKTLLSPLPNAAHLPRALMPGGEPAPKPIPASRSLVTASISAVSPARAPLQEREPAPCLIPASIAPVAPSSRAVSMARAAFLAPMLRAPTSSNTSNPLSGLAEAIEYYRELPALRVEIAWFQQQNRLAITGTR